MSHCWCYLSHSQIITWTIPPFVAIVVPSCYYIMLLVAIHVAYVLVKYYPHGHHLLGGELVVYHIIIRLSLRSTHHHHLPLLLLVLLLVYHVVSVLTILLCWICHGEVLLLPIVLCMWWSSFAINKKGKKRWILPFVCLFIFYFHFSFVFLCLKKLYI